MKLNLFCIFAIISIASIQQISSYGIKIITGYTKHHGWLHAFRELSTFVIYHYERIDSRDVRINTPPSNLIEGLSMKGNKKIQFLPIQVYQKFPNLLGYNAQNCALTEIRYPNFEKLNDLQALILTENKLVYIQSNTFDDLHNLQDLLLDGNNIQMISSQTFNPLRNLKYLQLDENEISYLSIYAFEKNRILENISLAGNKLKKLEYDHFKNNSLLTRIWLENNNIEFLDDKMFDHMKNLKFVNIKNNNCTSGAYFEDSFGEMKKVIRNNCKI